MPCPAAIGECGHGIIIGIRGADLAAALPGMFNLWASTVARDLVGVGQKTPDPPIAVTGYREPSLVFLLGTRTVLTSPMGAARHLSRVPGSHALIERGTEAKFRAAAQSLGLKVKALGAIKAFNLAKGRNVILTLYRAEPARP